MLTLRAKELVETDQWPAEIGEQMAAVHRTYPLGDTGPADPRLIKLLKLVQKARTDLLRQGLYRTNAAVCGMHAAAVPDPMKQFYQALEFQWECLARLAEREGPKQ